MTSPSRLTLAMLASLTFLSIAPATALAQRPAPDTLPQVARLFEQSRDQVVSVQTEMAAPPGTLNPFFNPSPGEPSRGQGSGFIVDERGLVITNWHVVN